MPFSSLSVTPPISKHCLTFTLGKKTANPITLTMKTFENITLLKPMICLMRSLSLTGIGAIRLVSLMHLLMRIISNFLRYQLYWLPELHKIPYKSPFISNTSSCATVELSILLTFDMILINKLLIKQIIGFSRVKFLLLDSMHDLWFEGQCQNT